MVLVAMLAILVLSAAPAAPALSCDNVSRQAPKGDPFEMTISTKLQCEGDPTCLKSYRVYEQVERDVAQQWPEGCFREVMPSHDIYAEKTDLVVAGSRCGEASLYQVTAEDSRAESTPRV
jgi:hypothetical protein